jgi:hypothetical protein
MSAKRLIQQGYLADDPAVKRGMVNDNAEFCHHFFQVAQTQGVSEIPANTLGDNISGVMQATEGFSDQRHGQATS